MILDSRLEFCDATALNTGAAGAYIIGNQADLGATSPGDIANGQPLYWVTTVDTAVDSGNDSTTVALALVSDSVATLDSSVSTHATISAQAQATLVAGKKYVVPIPSGVAFERYLGIQQTTGVTPVTAGKINSFITTDPTGWVALPDGI